MNLKAFISSFKSKMSLDDSNSESRVEIVVGAAQETQPREFKSEIKPKH
jgi:hypothetical protein